jgi:hypothetical protein
MKTIEQIKQDTLNYLHKTKLHLFKKDKTIMNAIPVTLEDKEYILIIKIDDDGNNLDVKLKELFKYEVDNNYIQLITKSYTGIFYDGYGKKWTSIKHFKSVNRVISFVYGKVLENKGLTESLQEEIKNNWEKYKIVWTEKK